MIFSPRLAEQYAALKQQAPNCLLLMQVGAFMDVLHEDARVVAAVTGLKLQMAGEVDAPVIPSALLRTSLDGFPQSGLDAYVGKLVRAGHSVAIALQDAGKERHIRAASFG